MKSLQHLFADMTASIEDLHGIAVEGQGLDVTPDVHASLALCLREQLAGIDAQLTQIENQLPYVVS
jgi:hypothetical protein